MADTTTTTYGLTKPEVGASEDTWGTKINANLDAIDDLLDGTTAVTGINITSGTVASSTLSGALPAVDGSALTGLAAFPSGTLMLFQQTAAPTGWTKQTTHNDKALRVVSGTASSGGSSAFTTAFGTPTVTGTVGISGDPAVGNLAVSVSGNIGSTTLSNNQIPSHNHGFAFSNSGNQNSLSSSANNYKTNGQTQGRNGTAGYANVAIGSTGGGGSHNHGHNLSGTMSGSPSAGNLAGSLSSATAAINVQYVDLIIASKD